MIKKTVLKILLPFILVSGIFAKEEPNTKKTNTISRSFIVNPAYFDERPFNSNDMMKDLHLSYMQGMSLLFDRSIQSSNNKFLGYGLGALVGCIQVVIAEANNTTYHEFGHARALASLGVDYLYGVPVAHKPGYAYQIKNAHELFWVILSHYDDYKQEGAYCGWIPFTLTSNQDLIISAAGLNNQMRYSQSIADVIHEKKGHLLYAFDYYKAKNSSYRYADITEQCYKIGYVSTGNDIHAVITRLKNNGINISTENIKDGSRNALLLSSTTWAFVYAAIFNLPKGNFDVPPPIWEGWRLPDVNFYMTTKGLSYEVITGYHVSPEWYIGLATEFVYNGKSFFELGPQISYKFNMPSGNYKVTGQVVLSEDGDFGGGSALDWTSNNKTWGLGAKYTCHNASTLVGERNIPSLKKGQIGHEFVATAQLNY